MQRAVFSGSLRGRWATLATGRKTKCGTQVPDMECDCSPQRLPGPFCGALQPSPGPAGLPPPSACHMSPGLCPCPCKPGGHRGGLFSKSERVLKSWSLPRKYPCPAPALGAHGADPLQQGRTGLSGSPGDKAHRCASLADQHRMALLRSTGW